MKTAVALTLLLAISAWGAPSAAAAEAFLSDPAGDTAMGGGVAGAELPPGPYSQEQSQSVDLLGLDLAETDDDLTITVSVASLAGVFTGSEYLVDFTWNDRQYRAILAYFTAPPDEIYVDGYLLVASGTDYDWVAYLGATHALDKNQVSMSIPKVYLLDSMSAPPGRGDSLTDIVVSSTREANFGFFLVDPRLRITDRMPDEGVGPAFTFALGDYSTGHLILNSPERIRVSNGGATTFVFKASLRNTGDVEDEFSLEVTDIPHDWNMTFQTPVSIAAKSEKTVSILASVPFGHTHGGFDAFNVTAKSKNDPNTGGRMKLGVVHTPIPMPAGHHSELYLHAQDPRAGNAISEVFAVPFPYAYGWMDTVEDHSQDHSFMSPNNFDNSDGATTLGWWIGLGSGMSMGMDFDVTQTGTLTGSILAGQGESKMAATLYYWKDGANDDARVVLAETAPIDLTLDPQASTPFTLTMAPTADADYVAYDGPANLILYVELKQNSPLSDFGNTPAQARLNTADFLLKLPLLEYHDRLDGTADAASGVEIVAEGLVEKAAFPGTLVTYTFNVKNTGAATAFIVEAAGNDAARARVVPRGIMEIGSGEWKKITVGVDVPADANEGADLEVLLFVHARDDPSKMAIARTKTTVTKIVAEAVQDETNVLLAAQAEQNNSPGAGLALVGLGLVAAALVARKKR